MKKLCNIVVVVSMFLLFSQAAHAILISLDPADQEVALGDMLSVDLTISGLGEYESVSLGAYDLDILFDPSILVFDSVVFGSALDIWGFGTNVADAYIAGSGVLDIFEISFDFEEDLNLYQPGSFTLATLTFGTIGSGTSFLNTSIDALVDASGWISLGSDVENASISVVAAAPVPEPATLLLITSGLAGIGIFRRKKI